MLKPETVMRGLIGEVVSRIERKGLTIVAAKLVKVNHADAERLYAAHREKSFFRELVDHVISGPVFMMIAEGPNAIAHVRKLTGATNPLEAEPGTIRDTYSLTSLSNAIHAADSPASAAIEKAIFFSEEEITSYEKPTEKAYLT